jgi:hypothetical protein
MRYLTLFSLIFLTSCMGMICIPPKHERIANTVSRRVVKTLAQRYGMRQVGSGGGMMDQVNMMFIAFSIKRLLTIIEARALIIDCAEEYLAEINSDEKLKPFLVTYPFPIKNIEIKIFFNTSEGYPVVYPYVGSISLYEGRIAYYKDDPKDPYKYKVKIYELYDEAVDILNAPLYNYE